MKVELDEKLLFFPLFFFTFFLGGGGGGDIDRDTPCVVGDMAWVEESEMWMFTRTKWVVEIKLVLAECVCSARTD